MIGYRVLPRTRLHVRVRGLPSPHLYKAYASQRLLIQLRLATTQHSPTSSAVLSLEGLRIINGANPIQVNKKELLKSIANPLQTIKEKIKSKAFTYPYNYLNEETELQLDLLENFTSTVSEQVSKCDNFDNG